jgi:pyruvate/2-oxoacid:ferredoxin oxidoreductase alpha subunit
MSLSAMQSSTLPPLQDAKGIENKTIPSMLKEIEEYLSQDTRHEPPITIFITNTIKRIRSRTKQEDLSINLQDTIVISRIVTEFKKIDESLKTIEQLIKEPI